MAKKFDYKAYLSQFGKVETDAKVRIKEYLEKQIQEDDALRNLYRPEKIDSCYNFIKDAVKATGCGSSAAIEDAVVFKMARDYFLEVLPAAADESRPVKDNAAAISEAEAGREKSGEVGAAETEPEVTESLPADNENAVKTDEYGFEVFGEEPESEKESGAETEEEAKTGAETEPEVTESLPADNENLGTPRGEAEPENEKPEDSQTEYDSAGNGLLFDF